MVEKDIYNLIIADATMDTLIGSDTGTTKIFPVNAAQGTLMPFITYTVSYGDMEEYLHTARITFKIVAENYETCVGIRNRLKVLLDLQDSISITSTDYLIKWSKLTGGYDMQDMSDDTKTEETGAYIIIQIYEIRYLEY